MNVRDKIQSKHPRNWARGEGNAACFGKTITFGRSYVGHAMHVRMYLHGHHITTQVYTGPDDDNTIIEQHWPTHAYYSSVTSKKFKRHFHAIGPSPMDVVEHFNRTPNLKCDVGGRIFANDREVKRVTLDGDRMMSDLHELQPGLEDLVRGFAALNLSHVGVYSTLKARERLVRAALNVKKRDPWAAAHACGNLGFGEPPIAELRAKASVSPERWALWLDLFEVGLAANLGYAYVDEADKRRFVNGDSFPSYAQVQA